MSGGLRGGYGFVGPAVHGRVEFVHVPPGGLVRAVVLCESFFGAMTHWIDGRRRPCVDGHCPGCGAGLSATYRAWLYVQVQGGRELIGMLELGAAQVGVLEDLAGEGNLRGRVVELRRPGLHRTARLEVRALALRLDALHLPPAIDLAGTLQRIWGLR